MLSQPVAQHGERAAVVGIEAGDHLIRTEERMLLLLAHVEGDAAIITTLDDHAREGYLYRDPTVDAETFVTVLMIPH